MPLFFYLECPLCLPITTSEIHRLYLCEAQFSIAAQCCKSDPNAANKPVGELQEDFSLLWEFPF